MRLLPSLLRAAALSVAVLCTALPVVAAPASPDAVDEHTRNAARELARDAVVAHEAGEHQRALDLIRRAHALVPAPSISIWEARILSRMGRLIEANERYEATRRAQLAPDAPEAFRVAVREAEVEVEALRERIPRIRIRVTGTGAHSASLRVTLDGKPMPRELIGVARTVDPGVHAIEARVPGVSKSVARLQISESEQRDVDLRLEDDDTGGGTPEGDTPPSAQGRASWSPRQTWGVVAAGVGAAGLATGVYFALAASDKRSRLDETCDGNKCPPSASEDLDAFRSARTWSLVGYGVGAAGLATSAVLLLVVKDEPPKAGAKPFLGVGVAGVRGRF